MIKIIWQGEQQGATWPDEPRDFPKLNGQVRDRNDNVIGRVNVRWEPFDNGEDQLWIRGEINGAGISENVRPSAFLNESVFSLVARIVMQAADDNAVEMG